MIVNRVWQFDSLDEPLAALLRGESYSSFETQESGPNGRGAVRLFANVLKRKGSPKLLILFQDITQEKQAELARTADRAHLARQVESSAEAFGLSQEQLRALTASLFTSDEDLHRRLARDLHDAVGQEAAVLAIEIERLIQEPDIPPAEVKSRLTLIRDRIASLMENVRTVSHRLHPSVLDTLGLEPALRELVEGFSERTERQATFSARSVPEHIRLDVSSALYRIAQEALQNVVKHAGRTDVRVSLTGGGAGLQLSIRDMGEGFDTSDSKYGGLGLLSMRERARLINATLRVTSNPGQGTLINVHVPLSGRNNETSSAAG